MNLPEAYKILELNQGATEDEANKQFKKLAAKFHPDINKDPGASDTFKKYSEALNTIKSGSSGSVYSSQQPRPGVHVRYTTVNQGTGFDDINDFINSVMGGVDFGGNFRRSSARPRPQTRQHEVVETSLHLTFAEAVLGCKKQIVLDKFVKCSACYGKGFDLFDDCAECKGKGYSIEEEKFEERNLKIRTTCEKCDGMGKIKTGCQKCNKTGSVKVKTNIDINLPGGVINGSRLKLGGQGNYNRYAGAEVYDDAHVSVTVDQETEMSIAGLDVISNLELSLLEALQGGSKDVRTVRGQISLKIPHLTKDKDRILIAGGGVRGIGNHVVTLNVKYPEDTQGLIDFLSKEG